MDVEECVGEEGEEDVGGEDAPVWKLRAECVRGVLQVVRGRGGSVRSEFNVGCAVVGIVERGIGMGRVSSE